MQIEIHKYGGTSLESLDKIKGIAKRTYIYQKTNNVRVILVLSAMGNSTDLLVQQASEITSSIDAQVLDSLMATGEQVSCSLMALALKDQGVKAQMVFGSQIGIYTDSCFGYAEIESLSSDYINQLLSANILPVVAGFQGVDVNNNITTLGRGGSDITAIAIAGMFKAKCYIYTDVDGVYTCDPRLVSDAKLLKSVSTNCMEKMACLGAQVLHPKAIRQAVKSKVDVWVKPAHRWDILGTKIDLSNDYAPTVIAIDNVICYSLSILPQGETIRQLFNRLDLSLYSVDLLGKFASAWQFSVSDKEKLSLLSILQDYRIVEQESLVKISIIASSISETLLSEIRNLISHFGIDLKRVIVTNNSASYFIKKEEFLLLSHALHKYIVKVDIYSKA